jgi:hypothetical protein
LLQLITTNKEEEEEEETKRQDKTDRHIENKNDGKTNTIIMHVQKTREKCIMKRRAMLNRNEGEMRCYQE